MEARSGTAEPSFLAVLDAEARADLRARGRMQSYPSGSVLLYEGQVEAPVIIPIEGLVRISALASDGRELVLAFGGPGSLLGELAALDEGQCSATVTAIDDLQAIVLSAGQYRAYLDARPDVAIKLLRLLGERLRDVDRKRVEFAALDTTGRVAARMVELADRFGEPHDDGTVVITLTLSQEELASWIGSSREATVKAIGKLRKLGLVDTGRRRIQVNDLAELQRLSVL